MQGLAYSKNVVIAIDLITIEVDNYLTDKQTGTQNECHTTPRNAAGPRSTR